MRQRPTQGAVTVLGLNAAHARPRQVARLRRRLGIIPQELNFMAGRTVSQNVRVVLDIAGRPQRAADEKTAALLELVGLTGLQDRYPHQLAASERLRVVLARALAGDPAILLADEPLAHVDETAVQGVILLLQKIHTAGTTVVLVTRDQRALALPGRSFELTQGRLAAIAPAANTP
jgi:ABC-type ATPase involved in cell division